MPDDPKTAADAAEKAVYDCVLPGGDTVAEMIHESCYIDDSNPLPAQLEQVRDFCRMIARAAVTAYQEHKA